MGPYHGHSGMLTGVGFKVIGVEILAFRNLVYPKP